MTEETIKKQILCEVFEAYGDDLQLNITLNPSVSLIEQAMEAYHEHKTRWISVEEDLPKEPMNCIVLIPNFIDKVTTREFHPDNGKFLDDRITHWQPLPTPPQINAE